MPGDACVSRPAVSPVAPPEARHPRQIVGDKQSTTRVSRYRERRVPAAALDVQDVRFFAPRVDLTDPILPKTPLSVVGATALGNAKAYYCHRITHPWVSRGQIDRGDPTRSILLERQHGNVSEAGNDDVSGVGFVLAEVNEELLRHGYR